MYQTMSISDRKKIKKQFEFSVSELDQMEKFINNNMGQTAKKILENLMADDNLSDRQKVLVSYILGTSVGVESVTKDYENINPREAKPWANMKIGQAG